MVLGTFVRGVPASFRRGRALVLVSRVHAVLSFFSRPVPFYASAFEFPFSGSPIVVGTFGTDREGQTRFCECLNDGRNEGGGEF